MSFARMRLMDHHGLAIRRGSGGVTLTLALTLAACSSPDASVDLESSEAWADMSEAEEAIVELGPQLKRLSQSVLNLRLPDPAARMAFGDSVSVLDLGTPGNGHDLPLEAVGASFAASAGSPRTVAGQAVDLWQTMLGRVSYFENAKFYVIRGHMLTDGSGRLETDVGFEALAHMEGGKSWLRGHQSVVWAPEAPANEETDRNWRIVGWESEGLETVSTPRSYFADVLDRVVSTDALVRARRSIHEELVLDLLQQVEGEPLPDHRFQIPAFDRHPGLAVTDINDDGFDDIYIMERWGRNMFFQNNGDGTFDEVAGVLDLDIEDHTSAALFADFDNDGDKDVFLGRTLRPSLYLVNEDGHFVDRSTDLVDGPLPALASSVSAVDYDNDGLLDLYVSTYAAGLTTEFPPEDWVGLMSPADGAELIRLQGTDAHHVVLNRFGPPNVLLRNLGGGKFGPSGADELKLFKNSYQATWSDFDDDGDMDVYLANDFAPNNLLRNDGGDGFTDVTDESGTADIGFGMGASWGDFDGDGDQDLYVSNMYSKAGRRITAQLGQLDPRFADMARGNTLFRNQGGQFERVSGLEPPSLLVEAAGWSWGSQFVDLDNDTDLDIYALSGYYSAPPPVELPVDI